MGTDNLTTIRAAVRAELADTGTDFSNAIIDQAVAEVVSDISRLAPRELISLQVLHSRTVTDESFTSSHDAWVNLANKPIDQQSTVVVTTSPAGTTYTEYTDYIIDYAQGRIQVLSAGSMADATAFLIDYEKSLSGVDISSLTDLVQIELVERGRVGGNSFQIYESWHKWGDILWLQSRNGQSQERWSENEHVRIWYKGEHSKPTTGAAGSYPAYLDDVVVKGAVAYSLFSKHRERQLQAITYNTSASTQNALADDDIACNIPTAISAANVSLAASNTALDLITTLASTPNADAEVALDSAKNALALIDTLTCEPLADAITSLGSMETVLALIDTLGETPLSAAQTALAAMATTLGNIDALGDTAIADIETALDAVITQLTGVTNSAQALLQDADITDIDALIVTALNEAQLLLQENAAAGEVSTALDKVVEHLESDTTNPDSAENQLAAGDSLINAINVGDQAALGYARYAELQVAISSGFVAEGRARIEQALGHIQEAGTRVEHLRANLTEVRSRIEIAQTFNQEAQSRKALVDALNDSVTNYAREADGRIRLTDTLRQVGDSYGRSAELRARVVDSLTNVAMGYVAEAERRLMITERITNVATGYVNEARVNLEVVDRYAATADIYISQARNYMEMSDREVQISERLLLDARERHADYWEHLTSRTEIARQERQQSTRQLPQNR